MRDALGTAVTLLVNVPTAAADAAGLPADKRTAGAVVKVRSDDAQELVAAGLATFAATETHGGTLGQSRTTALTPTATKTAPYTAAAGELAVMNVPAGATALTLPTSPADKAQVGFLAVGATSTAPLTVNRGGTDTIGPAGATSVTLVLANEVTIYQYQAAGTRWLPVANVKPQTALDSRFLKLADVPTPGTPTGDALRAAYAPQGGFPRPLPIAPAGGSLVTNFQSGHGWTIGGGNPGTVTDDTATFTLGSQSVKVATNGAGAGTRVEKTLTSFDATKFAVAVLVRVNDVTKLSSIKARIGSGAAATYYPSLWVTSLMASTLRSGEWGWITLDCGNAPSIGTPPAASAITYLGFDVFDNSTGTVQVNFQSVKLVPKPSTLFPNGVVSISFDDGYADQITNAKPILDKYGFPATAYVISDLLGATRGTYATVQDYLDAQNYSGWEIAAHAARVADHNLPNAFIDLTPAQMEQECQDMLAWFVANGFPVPTNIAWPQGKYSAANIAVVRKYFTLARTIDFQPSIHESLPPARLMEVRCRPMDTTTSAATLNGIIDQAYANGGWLHLYTHRVNASPTGTQITTATLQTVVDYLATKGIPVRTVGSVLQQLAAGRA